MVGCGLRPEQDNLISFFNANQKLLAQGLGCSVAEAVRLLPCCSGWPCGPVISLSECSGLLLFKTILVDITREWHCKCTVALWSVSITPVIFVSAISAGDLVGQDFLVLRLQPVGRTHQ